MNGIGLNLVHLFNWDIITRNKSIEQFMPKPRSVYTNQQQILKSLTL
jgi:hypothetical protein